MRRTSRVTIVLLLAFCCSAAMWSQSGATAYVGTVERVKVHGTSLEGNLDGDSPDRDVSVYLPASYSKDKTRRYPVIYFLHGFTDSEDNWFRKPGHFVNLPTALNKAFENTANHEMIVVMPNAFTLFEGSFYGTSVDTGDWDRFISDELVAYIDSHYRTLAKAESRGLAGHSMGGYGTIRIGMRHPEVFSSVYALSPCCLITAVEPNAEMKEAEAVKTPEQIHAASFFARAQLATAAAWSPDPGEVPLHIDLPVKDGKVQRLIVAKWAANAPIAMLDQYIPNVKRLKGIAMDVGDKDGLGPGLKLFDSELNAYKIPHLYEVYEGDHLNHIGDRIAEKVVPWFSKELAADTGRTTSK
jgi:S-formylglutathione hydrolase